MGRTYLLCKHDMLQQAAAFPLHSNNHINVHVSSGIRTWDLTAWPPGPVFSPNPVYVYLFCKRVIFVLQNKLSNLKENCQQGKKIKGSLTTETEKEDCIF